MQASARSGAQARRIARHQLRRLLFVPVVVVTALLAQAASASATVTNPYSNYGYDTSYPQCGATATPTGFAIIGLGHGRPFTTNSCSGAETKLAGPSGYSFYFNTGYAMAYQKNVTPTCKNASGSITTNETGHANDVLQTAWAIGCSEAAYAWASAPATAPVAWWADVETGNSWSSDLTVNQFTINGIVAELHTLTNNAPPIGVYSSPSMWDRLVGSTYANGGIDADWLSGSSCTASGFTLSSSAGPLAPVWLAQYGQGVFHNVTFDLDQAC